MRVPELRVSLLGAPSIQAGRTRIATDTRKATALLAYLALTSGPQHRAHLAALLWPEAGEERARGALRRTLSVLRSALGDRWIVADGETIRLDRTDLRVDVEEVRAALAAGRRDEAVALYRGDFLAGFSLRDSPAFDEWQRAQSEALRADLAGALSRLVADATARGDDDAAIAHARRRVDLDPLDESARVDLMRLHARGGDRSAALREYRELARILDRELGVTPLPETRALRDAIAAGLLVPAPRDAGAAAAEAVGDAHALHGDYRRAIASYEEARKASAGTARATVEHKLAQVHHRRGDWSSAERHYEQAFRSSASDAERARILADRSLAAERSGDRPRADRLARDALRLATASGDRRALAQAHNILGILEGPQDAAAGRRHLETSASIAETLDEVEPKIAVLNNLAIAHRRAGELADARTLTERALALAETIGDRHRIAALHNNLADVLRDAGAMDDARRHLRRAVTLFAEIGEASTSEPEVWKLVEW